MDTEDHYAWGAVMTLPRAEVIAEQAINEAGYVAWLPQYHRRRVLKGARIEFGRKIRSRHDTVSLEPTPLFRGYLFVQIPHGDYADVIDKSHGVLKLLRNPSTKYVWPKPKLIRARFIIQLQEWVATDLIEDERGKIVSKSQRQTVRGDLRIGDRVATPSGVIGTLSKLDEAGRAELLTEMLGAPRVIRNVNAETLELISA
jgi:hypothetical protein